jgi:D-alanyl-D-alanine carboxypeptidase
VAILGAQPAEAVVHASIVVDADTGKVLEAYHANTRTHPASLTKLMTLYFTFGRLESGKWTLNHRLRVSEHAAAQQPTKLWLRPGSTITVRDAILGITTRSANDAAVVLAENMAGSEWRFAKMMNVEARRLGMTRTVFYNASGLPNARQWTTARDMSKLAITLIHKYPQYYHFFSARSFDFEGHIIYGHDHLLTECRGVDGMKTGYVNASGFNIVTSAVRDHRRLVGVVLGGRTARVRDLRMIALLNRAFATASPATTEEVASVKRPRIPAAHGAEKSRAARMRLVDTSPEAGVESSDWVIQIGGGFHSERSVRRVLHSAVLTEPALRRGRQIVVKLRGRRYRARFSNLSHEMAAQACLDLGRRHFTCEILNHTPERDNDIADASVNDGGRRSY